MAIEPARLRPGLAALALCLLIPAAPATAQNAASLPGESRDLHAGTLEVPVNKSQIVNADRTIAKAMIGNDEVADILPLSSRSLYVLGKKMGTTSLTLYDAGGRVIAVMDVAVGPDVEALQSQLNDLVPGEDVRARISNDSIVLTGMVSSPGAAHTAERLARTYAGDKVVNMISLGSGQQVMLEVQFAEVDRATGREVGLSGFASSKGGSFDMVLGRNSQLIPNPDTGVGELKLESITGQAGIFRNVFGLGNLSVEAVLNALETKGMARTLAKPTLVAISGERASFLAGGEFPIPVAQSGSSGSNGNGAAITVEFKTFGVSLAFTPTVLSDKTIHLIVEPEVSELDSNASLTLNGITVPGLRTRRVNTTLELRDGESFAIAGLLQQDSKANISQLPILGSIPILGALFRSTRYQKGDTELLIVVTPRLVAPIRPEQVVLPTDRVREPSDAETFLLGQPYQPRELPPVPSGDAAKKDNDYGF
ncbi:type II and III secretion system protein family protein [Novosphingobium sp.]|uniref:type II and III secretion system protein family protein n=1 Tax=Novosphingobium sp. TaxID=1874826 RepID=UPI0035B124DA